MGSARSAPGAKFEAWEKKGKSEGQFGSKMVKVALIKEAIGKTVKGPALLETQPPPYAQSAYGCSRFTDSRCSHQLDRHKSRA